MSNPQSQLFYPNTDTALQLLQQQQGLGLGLGGYNYSNDLNEDLLSGSSTDDSRDNLSLAFQKVYEYQVLLLFSQLYCDCEPRLQAVSESLESQFQVQQLHANSNINNSSSW